MSILECLSSQWNSETGRERVRVFPSDRMIDMHRTLSTQLLAAALLAACTDPPLATGPVDNAVVAFALSSPCTKSWVNPGGGAWEDGGNWLPIGVPGAADYSGLDVVFANAALSGRIDVIVQASVHAGRWVDIGIIDDDVMVGSPSSAIGAGSRK